MPECSIIPTAGEEKISQKSEIPTVREGEASDKAQATPTRERETPDKAEIPTVRERETPDKAQAVPTREGEAPDKAEVAPVREREAPEKAEVAPTREGKMPLLSKRLLMAAQYARKGKIMCDIGTDHAFLPAYLIKNNISTRALACDLREGPLDNARKTVERFELGDKIELRISDGLGAVGERECEDIFICGMGGNLISDILLAAPFIKNDKYRLILQPQSHAEDVRSFLYRNGFCILNESVCEDMGKLYLCIVAEYDGKMREWNEDFLYYGLLPGIQSPESEKMLENIRQRREIKAYYASLKGE